MPGGDLTWWAPWALPVSAPPVANVLVVVRGGVIAAIEERVSREDAIERGAECFDDCVLAPGFVNAHSHIEYAAYESLTDGLAFPDWIQDHVARKRRLQAEHMRASAVLGAWQAAAGGITTLGDASFSGDAAWAIDAVGLRGRVHLEVFDGGNDPDEVVAKCLRRLRELPRSELLDQGISPHAPYTVSVPLYRAVAATGLPWMTHLHETAAELAGLRDGRGPMAEAVATFRPPASGDAPWGDSAVQTLADVLGPHVVAVHLVHVSGADLEVLASTGTPVAHCPRSNARLGCGLLELHAFDRAGILVSLATDSPASAGPIDMFAEMRSAIEQHRAANQDATFPDAARVLRMATVDGAHVLGYGPRGLGTLEVGAPADVVACHTGPTRSPLNQYVLGCTPRDVRATAVGGRVVWRHDRNDLRQAAERAAAARTLLDLPTRSAAGRVP